MEELFYLVVCLGPVAYIVFGIISLKKEVRLASFYNGIKVAGRWKAFFASYLLLVGVASLVVFIVMLIMGLAASGGETAEGTSTLESSFVFAFLAVGASIPGFLIHMKMYKKCPVELRKRYFGDMFIIFFGNLFKISIIAVSIFIRVFWRMSTAIEYRLSDGQIVYVYPKTSEVYDNTGKKIGKAFNVGKDDMRVEFL